jgi:glycosyltransferase involved in cell wall biosynthesis
MRIAYVSADPGVPPFGTKGASVHVQEMLRAFLRRGATVTLISPRLENVAPADLAAITHVALPSDTGRDAEARAAWAIETNEVVTAALAAAGPVDFVYERHALFAHGAMAFAAARGLPSALEVNAPLIEEQARHRSLPLPAVAEAVAQRVFAEAGALLAVSPGVADYLARFRPGRQGVHVVDNGVDPARFAAAAAARQPWAAGCGRPLRIGFLGTLKPWHGVEGLVDAFARLVCADPTVATPALDAELQLIGDGPQRAALLERAHRLGVGARLQAPGALDPAAVPAALAALDVGVAPYPAGEGFYFSPLKLFEYMAAGLPLVTTDVGHLRHLVQDGVDGLIVPADDPDTLASALRRLAGDAALARRLGAAARRRAVDHCSWDAVAGRILALAAAVAAQPAVIPNKAGPAAGLACGETISAKAAGVAARARWRAR